MSKYSIAAVICAAFLSLNETHSMLSDTIKSIPDSVYVRNENAQFHLKCDLNGVKIFLDSVLIGVTPVESLRIEAGLHVLWFIHPDGNNWSHPAIIESLYLHPMEICERKITFPSFYDLTTYPFGAKVSVTDSIKGTTPLRLSLMPGENFVTLSKDGFETVVVSLPPGGGPVHIVLKTTGELSSDKSAMFLNSRSADNLIPLYVSAGGAIAGGFTAAYLKIKADSYYQEYNRTGDNRMLDRVKRLDTVSGISLAVSEISLIIVSYLLFSR